MNCDICNEKRLVKHTVIDTFNWAREVVICEECLYENKEIVK